METQFFAYVQLRKLQVVRLGDLRPALRLTPRQEKLLLSRLSKAEVITRVYRGVYLVPSTLPLGGIWNPSEILALNTLMEEKNGQYQICGPNAFNRYGFDEQIPNRMYAYNNRLSGDRKIGNVALTLIKVSDERLGSADEIVTPDGMKAFYASRVRTLVDAVYDWSRFNSLPRGYYWIKSELAKNRITAAELVKTTLRYGDVGTIRRIALLLEKLNVRRPLLRRLAEALPATTSWIPWIPSEPKRGVQYPQWGVVLNGDV